MSNINKLKDNMDKYIKLINITTNLIAVALSVLCTSLVSWDEFLEWIKHIEFSSISILYIICIAFIVISMVTSILTLIYVYKKYNNQQKRMSTMLNCCIMANKDNYSIKLENLYEKEEITLKELKELKNTLEAINNNNSSNVQIIIENIDGLYDVVDKLSKEESFNVAKNQSK